MKNMKNILIKSDIILLFLICIALTLIILFVDFSKDEKTSYNTDVYKAYYTYDIKSEPVSISYYMINVNKSSGDKKIIEEIFNKIGKNIDEELTLSNISVLEDKVILIVNKSVLELEDKISIECLVNSILELNNYKTVEFKYREEITSYEKTLSNYYISSPIVNKLSTFLYKDSNYKLIYTGLNDEKVSFSIKKTNSKEKITYTFNDEDAIWQIKKDGLYVNNINVLIRDFTVNEVYQTEELTIEVESIKLNTDNTLTVCLNGASEPKSYKYCLKQGLGLLSYEERENEIVIKSYNYSEKVFIES